MRGFGGPGRGDFEGRGRGREEIRGRAAGGGFGGRGLSFLEQLRPNRESVEGTAARPTRHVPLLPPDDYQARLQSAGKQCDEEVKELIARPPATRPDFGSRGTTIKVLVNHFVVTCSLDTITHYDVEYRFARRDAGVSQLPEKPLPADLCRAAIEQLARSLKWGPAWAFDGRKSIFTASPILPEHQQHFQIDVADPVTCRTRNLQVTTQKAQSIDMRQMRDFVSGRSGMDIPQVTIQALDVVLKKHAIMSTSHLVIGRGLIFNMEQVARSTLGNGAEAWTGYIQSLRFGQGCLTLNVDLACTAFLEEVPVLGFLAQAAKVGEAELSAMNNKQRKQAEKAISGIKVEVMHMGSVRRCYRVKGFAPGGAANLTFEDEQNQTRTVAKYFEQRYGVRLQHPYVPCLNVGSPKRPVYLPPEVCKIAKAQRRLQLDPTQTSNMIRVAAKRPAERKAFIDRAVNQQAKFPQDPAVQAFGMTVGNRMMEVNARLLQAPELQYARKVMPRGGSWNMTGSKFYRAASFASYGIATFDRREDPQLLQFIADLLVKLRVLGLECPQPSNFPRPVWHDGDRNFPGETMEQAAKEAANHFGRPADIIFVCLPSSRSLSYSEVKRASDSYLGIASQCFVADRKKAYEGMPNRRDQYLSNIAMKINAKLDGVNVVVHPIFAWQAKPYMLFGADVTHHATGDLSKPSIASVCGSIDQFGTRFASCSSLLASQVRVEIILTLKDMVKDLLRAFYGSTGGRKPERLIFYRDGVSEGQFAVVQQLEVSQVLQACRELGRDAGEVYRPLVTFIVVRKRHNTKIFPMRPEEADRNGNCLPGTVVDSGIVHPTNFSFFLNSHGGLQGTNRSALYTVLLDQIGFTADQLQAFTYHMTYTFARCTRSVSICPPAYYAHLAAERGRHLLVDRPSGSEPDVERAAQAEFAHVHRDLRARMFYV